MGNKALLRLKEAFTEKLRDAQTDERKATLHYDKALAEGKQIAYKKILQKIEQELLS